jgi:Tfp pilus assembly protein PilF
MRSVWASIRNIFLAGAAIFAAACQSSAPPAHAPDFAKAPPAAGDVMTNTSEARSETDRAFILIGQNHFDDAAAILKNALIADPMYGPAHNDLGLIYYHQDQLYNAAWEFQNASKLMPHQAEPLNNLGLVLEKAQKLRDAEQTYEKAVAIDPENVEYSGNLARARIRLGMRDETTRKLLELIILKDTRPDWVQWARSNLFSLPTTEP